MKTIYSEKSYTLQDTTTGKFANFTNVGGYDNEKWQIYWVKSIESAREFSSIDKLIKFANIKKNLDKYQIVEIQRITNIDNVCCIKDIIK